MGHIVPVDSIGHGGAVIQRIDSWFASECWTLRPISRVPFRGYKGDVMTVNEMPNTPYPIAVAYGYRYTFELVKSLYILVVWRVRE